MDVYKKTTTQSKKKSSWQKHIRLKDIKPILKKLAIWGSFKILSTHGAHDYIEAMIYHLINASETHNVNAILNILAEELPNERERAMIIAEQLKRQGIKIGFKQGLEKGMEKGVAEGLYRIAKSMLEAGEPIEKVYSYTGLLLHEIKKMHDDDGLDYLD